MDHKGDGLREYFLRHDFVGRCTIVIGTLLSLFVIFVNSGFTIFDLWMFKVIVLMGVYTIGYLPHISPKKDDGTRGFNGIYFLLLVIALIPLIYLTTQMDRLNFYYGSMWEDADIIMGTLFIISTIVLTQRCFGWAMPAIGLLFLAYVLFGNYLPRNFFGHMGFDYDHTISFMFGPAAIFGEILSVFVKIVYIYLLFGAFLQFSGATDFMIDFSSAYAGKWRGGPAKIAVISSALMGTISGNAVANVATTGAVTIPLMKRTGYQPHFAGAVEAVASTGGQFLPPIMGAAAFIMAELLSISYTEVIIAATIPAILYFVCVLFTVDLEAVRLGLRGMRDDEVPNGREVLKHSGHLLLPIVVLVFLLIVSRMSVARAGLISTACILLVSFFRPHTSMNMRKIVEALVDSAKGSVGIAVVITTAGLIIGAVGMTGLGMRFSSVVLNIAQDNSFLVALLTAAICLVLGMGLPTTAAYIIAVSVASTTMLKIGIQPLAAHLFVFYFAAISTITPPVAVSAFTAASMAGAPMIKTGVYATMLGITGFVVPFIFIYSPELLMQGSTISILLAVGTAFIGLSAISMGMEGVCFFGGIRWNPFQRLLLLSSAIWLLIPGLSTDLIGAAIIMAAFISNRQFWTWLTEKKDAKGSPGAHS